MKTTCLAILFLLSLLLSIALAGTEPAGCKVKGRFPVLDTERTICELESGALVSSNCLDAKSGQPNCKAYDAAKNAAKKMHSGDSKGASPGQALCQNLGGKVLYSRDSSYNEYCFCGFSDRSLISCDGILLESRRPKAEK